MKASCKFAEKLLKKVFRMCHSLVDIYSEKSSLWKSGTFVSIFNGDNLRFCGVGVDFNHVETINLGGLPFISFRVCGGI